MNRPGWGRLAGVLVVLLVAGSAIGGVAGGAGPADEVGGSPEPAVSVDGTPTPPVAEAFAPPGARNNSTVQHENPEAVDEDGDLGEIKGWLVGKMADRLRGSTLELSQGEYDLARAFLGDEYDDRLDKYVDVAGETEGDQDDETGETLRETKEDQREYVSRVRQYRRTLDRYREAREAGNTTRARTLARELNRDADSIVETGRTLQADYAAIGNLTGQDLARASRTIETITENVSARQADIREDLFVETTLSVQARDRVISFASPLVLEGQLRAADGSTLGDRVIALRIGNRTITTRTDEGGGFVVRYRPVRLRTGEQSIAVRYRPRNASVYLGDRASVAVDVAAVTPTLSVEREPATARYGERVTLSGTVRAAARDVPGLPVVVSLDGKRLGVVHTDADGSFALESTLPADVSVGEVAVRAQVALENRAIERTATQTALQVLATDTQLSLNGTGIDAYRISVTGRLRTAEGRPVTNQPVALVVNGSVIETIRTDAAGRFDRTTVVPDRFAADDEPVTIRVGVAFDGEGTNLDDAREQVDVELVPPADGSGDGDGGDGAGGDGSGAGPGSSTIGSWLPVGLWPALGGTLAVLVVGVLGVIAVRRRSADDGDREANETASDSSTAPAGDVEATGGADEPTPTEAATERLDADDSDGAVELAYLGVREELAAALAIDGTTGTHWEFLETCRRAGLDDERLADLESLTETYEQAAFAPTAVDSERARAAIERGSSLSGEGE